LQQLSHNREFSSARVLAILSRTQLLLLDRYRQLLPQVFPGVQIICPDDLDDMQRILERSQATHELVLSIGGDGTLNRVLQHIDLDRQVLGCLPSGTGNDFARFIGFPADQMQRVAFLSGLISQATDFCTAGSIRYINSAGFGIDTETLLERDRRSGFLRNNYNLLFLLALSRMKCQHLEVRSREFSESGRYYWILGMNAALIGGGTRIAPDARLDDGLLDMLLIRETTKLSMIGLMPAAIRGTHIGNPMVEYHQLDSFTVESDVPIEILAIDGEQYSWKRRSLEFRCVPRGLRLLR
jgi:diacylglycerol kinase (ATP)